MLKRCSACHKELTLDSFWKNKQTKDGLKSDCKNCSKQAVKNWHRQNPEKQKEYSSRNRKRNSKMQASVEKAWRKRNRDRHRQTKRKNESSRRARKRQAFIEVIDHTRVFERDKGVCGICKGPVSEDYHIDHIVPLARGGEHSYANVQLAHPICNQRKGCR